MKRTRKARIIPNWLLYSMAAGCRCWDWLCTSYKALDRTAARAGSALRVEVVTYMGKKVLLQDGTKVKIGDRVVVLHLNNQFLKEVDPATAVRAFKSSLGALVAIVNRDPRFTGVLACHADTIFWNIHSLGFESKPLSLVQELLVRWGSRLLLVGFRRDGIAKVDRYWGLEARRIWISVPKLKERF